MESTDDTGLWDRVLLVVVAAVAVYALALVFAGLWLGDTLFDLLGFGPEDGNVVESQREYIRGSAR
jgi:hypothetical protein